MKNRYIKILLLIPVILLLANLASCGLFYFDAEASSDGKTVDSTGKSSDSVNDPLGSAVNGHDYVEGGKKENQETLYTVTEVIDGDTFIIGNSESVRLVGINTPESGMFFYEEAKAVLRIICEGKEVSLEKDVTDRDQYGRLLRYAFYGNIFINLEMIQKGFANVFTLSPDVKYQDLFIEAERYARNNNLGLWERSEYSFISGSSQGQPSISVEINWDAEGDDKQNMNDEYVIFKNNSGKNIDIGGWTVKDSATNTYEFKKHDFKSGSEITLYSGQGNDGDGKFYWKSDMPVWNNSTDTLYLRDRQGLLVEMFNY